MGVKIRLTGNEAEVAAIARLLHQVLEVVSESRSYPNREDKGVRRYLEVSLPEGDREG